jgi:hypothetical protein
MSKLSRGTLGRVALALGFALPLVWLIPWGTAQVLNLAGYSQLAEEQERVRVLEEEHVRTLRRGQMRRDVVAAVITGRMPLLQAAGAFRELNRGAPSSYWGMFGRLYPGASDEERHCRQVIAYVRTELEEYPGGENEVVRRLEAALRAQLERGPLQLPEPPRTGPGSIPE